LVNASQEASFEWMHEMSPEIISFLEIFGISLLAIILGLLILALAAFAIVQFWQKKTQTDLEQIRKQLRLFSSRSGIFKSVIQQFTPTDPPPFGPLAEELEHRIGKADLQLQDLQKDYSEIRDGLSNLRMEEWINTARLPYDWYRIRQKTSALLKKLGQVEQTYNTAGETVTSLERQGWEIAHQARQVLADNQAAVSILTSLYNSEIQDQTLELSLADARECEQWLSTRIPVYFLSGDEQTVLTQSDKASISQVHAILSQARPGVEELLTKAKSWNADYSELKQSISELVSAFRELSPHFSQLESNVTNPLDWDQSRQVLAALRVQIEGLSTGNKTRSLDEISYDLEKVNELSQRQRELSVSCAKVEQQYNELLELIENPEIRQGEQWIRQAQKYVEQMEEYSPENWPRSDQVDRLGQDLQTLSEHYRKVSLSDPSEPVIESKIPFLLEETRSLVKLQQGLRGRVASAQARHGELKEMERSSRETLSSTRALLNQAASLAASNPHLSKIITSEIKQHRESLEEMIGEFDRPGEGSLEKKSQKAIGLVKKTEQSAARWLEQLNKDFSEKLATLEKKVATLREIAALDDPAVLESQRIVSQASMLDPSKRKAGKQQTFSEIIAETKQRNEEWQICVAASRAIDDIQGPVLERYRQADQQRSLAAQWLNHAISLVPDDRSWPATSQVLTSERQQFKALEEQWYSLREKAVKAIDLVAVLSELGGKYQVLASKLKQTAETAEQDQKRIRDLEHRFEESFQMWQYQMNEYSDNLLTKDAISKLLNEANAEMDGIRQRYQRENIPYHHVLQQMRALCQRLDSAEAPYDQNHIIDINGDMQVLY
jgi:hypothetical protein